jgi:hypothetical protein
MSALAPSIWQQANYERLHLAIEEVAELLRRRLREAGLDVPASPGTAPTAEDDDADESSLDEMFIPPSLDVLCSAFGLSELERGVLLMCVGVEVDPPFAQLCAAAQPESLRGRPSFGLAMATFPEPNWQACTPDAPLRRWKLVEVGAADTLTGAPLRIDERVLHFIMGQTYVDERLADALDVVPTGGRLVPSHQEIADHVAAIWSAARDPSEVPVIQLCGPDPESRREIALAASRASGLNLLALRVQALSPDPAQLGTVIRLCEREVALSRSALLVEYDEAEPTEAGGLSDVAREAALSRLVDDVAAFTILSARTRMPSRRPVVAADVDRPKLAEQLALWQSMLGSGPAALAQADRLASEFDLSAPAIRAAHAAATISVDAEAERAGEAEDVAAPGSLWQAAARPRGDAAQKPIEPEAIGQRLWDDCRARTRPRLEQLAQRIESRATWDALILPERQRQVLRELAMHVRRRSVVYDQWGFANKSARGLGVTALFAGGSGTGKTMAAEVLANELRLDLYRIDLSATVSKYIGETEKNLRRIFDGADTGGVILLFDEADALFGKRSEVRDSHDRFANIEVSYLLQRMEAFRGLAILTTNLKDLVDKSFLRRLRFVVEFPYPDTVQRAAIWRRAFPAETPTRSIDIDRLTALSVTGANVESIALRAAFLAADASEPVSMEHVLQAARSELA